MGRRVSARDEVADLMESLVPVAAALVQAVREEGPDDVAAVLARVPTDVKGVAHLPGGAMAALAMVCAAMVSPDAGVRTLLGWTDTMQPGPRKDRGEHTKDGGWDPPAERERQRLVAAGVPADQAILMAARQIIQEQEADRGRRLRIVHDDDERQPA